MSTLLSNERKKQYCQKLARSLPVLRARLEITQEELSTRLGVSRTTLACIESGKKEMSWIAFIALSMLFLKNKKSEIVFKSLNIFDKELIDFLMFEDKDKSISLSYNA